jgi:hypothetical protein
MLSHSQFSHYLNILLSLKQGDRQKIDVLQDLFFLLLKGEHLHPDQWEKLIFILVEIVSSSSDDTLRRWAYQVGTLSLGNNRVFVEFCTKNFDKESNLENRSWVAAILSRNLPANQFYNILNKSDHKLTNDNLLFSTSLFSKTTIVNFKDVLRESDPLSLIWLANIGAYKNIAERNKQNPFVTPTELSILTAETDNDEVLKHVMYAFYLQNTFSVTDLLFCTEDYSKMGNQQKKWYFSLIWKDSNFLMSNIDYFRELLSDKHLFHEINEEVRIGLARGLESSKYTPDISRQLLDWYSHEDTPSTLYYLLKYFQKHQNKFKEYKEIIEYQKKHGDSHLKELILLNDVPEQIYNTKSLLINSSKDFEDESIQTLTNNRNRDVTVVKIENISANQVQFNEIKRGNAQAIMTSLVEPNYEGIRSEVENLKVQCSKEVKTILEDAIGAAIENDESKLKKTLKTVLSIGKNVFESVATECTVAYLRAIGFMP